MPVVSIVYIKVSFRTCPKLLLKLASQRGVPVFWSIDMIVLPIPNIAPLATSKSRKIGTTYSSVTALIINVNFASIVGTKIPV